MTASLVPAPTSTDPTRMHCSVAAAARVLGVSQSTIRRAGRKLGIRRFSGRTVAGAMLIARHPYDIVIVYSRADRG